MENRRRRAISSSIGKVNMGGQEPGRPQVLTVDDFSEEQLDLNDPYQRAEFARRTAANFNVQQDMVQEDIVEPEEKIEQLKELKRETKEGRASKQAVSRFEILAGISRIAREVVIQDNTFMLRSLKSQEHKEVMLSIIDCKNKLDEIYSLREQTLARAIISINDQELSFIVGGNDIQNKVEFIQDLDETIVQYLYEQYDDMIKTHRKNISSDLGNEPTEVLDNLKK